MIWYQHKKDINYYNRLSIINLIKAKVNKSFEINSPVAITPPIVYTYSGGKVTMINLERYQYMSQFKRLFTVIRVQLDNGAYVPLEKLRLKHLLSLSQFILK